MRAAWLAALLVPLSASAQEVELREPGPAHVASIVRTTISRPHTVRAGAGSLVLPRDSVFGSSLLVLGQQTYLASRVDGDVVVVGGDLFLRPGSNITGRAVAIGGTVARTWLGRVGGEVESLRDDAYSITPSDGKYILRYTGREPDAPPFFQLGGVSGLLMPSYDRVNGLSLPVGALVTLGHRSVELLPRVTYRSRLGVVDPGVGIHVRPDEPVRLEADIGRSTRTNEGWIYSTLINSATSFAFGNDTRNYFRADGGTARVLLLRDRTTHTFEPFVGARHEKVSPITATGNVYSVTGRKDVEHMARPNPLVEPGTITSALAGARATYEVGTLKARLSAEGERSFRTPTGTSAFTQLTLDGSIQFPTFGTQRLRIDAHAVASAGDSVPRARFAYLGRGGTLPLLELLEQGGDQLLFIESRYEIPIASIVLGRLGSPTIHLRHMMGAAGIGSLPSLEQQVGLGAGISFFHANYVVDAAGDRDPRFSVGVSLAR